MGALESLRGEARRLYLEIVGLARKRREVVKRIAEAKRAAGSPPEDYQVELRYILESEPDGQLWRLFSVLIMDSLESQGLRPISGGAPLDDSASCGCVPEEVGVEEVKEEIRSLVGARPADVLGPRPLVILSWLVAAGLGRPVLLLGPLPRSYDSFFWTIGSRPYRALEPSEAEAFKEASPLAFLRAPDLYGRVEPYEGFRWPEALVDSTHAWIGGRGLISRSSIMAVPGTEGTPWEATAVFSNGLRESYEALGLRAPESVLRCRPGRNLEELIREEMMARSPVYRWEAGPFLSYRERIEGYVGVSGELLGSPSLPWSYNIVRSRCRS